MSSSRWRRRCGLSADPRVFATGPLLAVNLGDDADTTGAIYGQIAGAHYGVEAIPAEWRRRLTMKAEIESLADQLYEGAMKSDHRGFTSL